MKYVPGRVFKDPTLSELAVGERADFYHTMCKTLAAIHSVDIEDARLESFGKQGKESDYSYIFPFFFIYFSTFLSSFLPPPFLYFSILYFPFTVL